MEVYWVAFLSEVLCSQRSFPCFAPWYFRVSSDSPAALTAFSCPKNRANLRKIVYLILSNFSLKGIAHMGGVEGEAFGIILDS